MKVRGICVVLRACCAWLVMQVANTCWIDSLTACTSYSVHQWAPLSILLNPPATPRHTPRHTTPHHAAPCQPRRPVPPSQAVAAPQVEPILRLGSKLTKSSRAAAIERAKAKVWALLKPSEAPPSAPGATPDPCQDLTYAQFLVSFDTAVSTLMRKLIIDEGRRPDGRAPHELRHITANPGYLPPQSAVHGSALFARGETQALCTATIGADLDAVPVWTPGGMQTQRLLMHYASPPFATGDVRGGSACLAVPCTHASFACGSSTMRGDARCFLQCMCHFDACHGNVTAMMPWHSTTAPHNLHHAVSVPPVHPPHSTIQPGTSFSHPSELWQPTQVDALREPSRREVGHGALALRALLPSMPAPPTPTTPTWPLSVLHGVATQGGPTATAGQGTAAPEWPFVVRLHSQTLASNGSSSMVRSWVLGGWCQCH